MTDFFIFRQMVYPNRLNLPNLISQLSQNTRLYHGTRPKYLVHCNGHSRWVSIGTELKGQPTDSHPSLPF